MHNLGQIGLRNGEVCVCVGFFFFLFFVLFWFCFVFFVFVFVFCFCFCFFLFCLFVCLFVCLFFFILFYSWLDLNLRLYHHNARFQFQKYKIFSFSEDTFPSDTPVCMQACNWSWRSTNSSPNVEDGCQSLCSFGVIAVVKCLVDKL